MEDEPKNNVIRPNFGSTSVHSTHVTGTARCLRCKHEWEMTVEFANRRNWITCVECGVTMALLAYPYEPAAGEEFWRCRTCANRYMIIMRDGVLCPGCGVFSHFPGEWVR